MKKRKTQKPKPVKAEPPAIYRLLSDGPRRWVAVCDDYDEADVFATIQKAYDYFDWLHEGNFIMSVHGATAPGPGLGQ